MMSNIQVLTDLYSNIGGIPNHWTIGKDYKAQTNHSSHQPDPDKWF